MARLTRSIRVRCIGISLALALAAIDAGLAQAELLWGKKNCYCTGTPNGSQCSDDAGGGTNPTGSCGRVHRKENCWTGGTCVSGPSAFLVSAQPNYEAMALVDGGGAGPAYDYYMGYSEVSSNRFAIFLNDAELDGGATERGSNLVFQPDGRVETVDGSILFRPSGTGDSRISYDPSQALGTRYRVEPGYGCHPVVDVGWIGAVKYANWLTVDLGFGASERCYTEGPNTPDWRPTSISAPNWSARDLNAAERLALVNTCRGFRLPMDNLGSTTGFLSSQQNAYNEWYKAAAHSPGAAGGVDSQGATVSANHVFHGFGRAALTAGDSNYGGSGDPFDEGTSPTGFYDGTTWNPGSGGPWGDGSEFASNANANHYGIYDLSGNVWEHVQDYAGGLGAHSVRGGSWLLNSLKQWHLASGRSNRVTSSGAGWLGFRLVQVSSASSAYHGGRAHGASGAATLISSGGPLVISNIGMSGLDGVTVSVSEATFWESEITFSGSGFGTGIQLVVNAETSGGGSPSVVSSATMLDTGSSRQLSADFTGVGSATYELALHDIDLNLVQSFSGWSGVAATLSSPAETFAYEQDPDTGEILLVFGWPSAPASVTIAGQGTFAGSFLVLTSENSSVDVVHATAIDISGISSGSAEMTLGTAYATFSRPYSVGAVSSVPLGGGDLGALLALLIGAFAILRIRSSGRPASADA